VILLPATFAIVSASAWALVEINPRLRGLAERCLEPLTRGLRQSDAVARSRAAEALGKLGPAAMAAVPALEELALDQDETVRESAAAAIRKIAR
jgi:hypothetical protein